MWTFFIMISSLPFYVTCVVTMITSNPQMMMTTTRAPVMIPCPHCHPPWGKWVHILHSLHARPTFSPSIHPGRQAVPRLSAPGLYVGCMANVTYCSLNLSLSSGRHCRCLCQVLSSHHRNSECFIIAATNSTLLSSCRGGMKSYCCALSWESPEPVPHSSAQSIS